MEVNIKTSGKANYYEVTEHNCTYVFPFILKYRLEKRLITGSGDATKTPIRDWYESLDEKAKNLVEIIEGKL